MVSVLVQSERPTEGNMKFRNHHRLLETFIIIIVIIIIANSDISKLRANSQTF
jgi:hypothetical protein